MNTLSTAQLANMIDHTILKPTTTNKDILNACLLVKQYGCKMIATNSVHSKHCVALLKDTPVHVGAAIGFPLGQTSIAVKHFECVEAIQNGVDEIDYVINIGELIAGNYSYIEEEMRCIVSLCKSHNVLCKVIFENCYLRTEEKIKACEIALEVRPDFIKTSTGFGTSGATIEDVKLMKSIVKDAIFIKAAGGINNLATCLSMIEAGATRIGTSSTISILNELQNK